jgi:long-chain acyl-CoA synthetase
VSQVAPQPAVPHVTGEIYARLTSPEGPFPLTGGEVSGRPMQVFGRGPRSLVEAFLATRAYGAREALVYRDERWTYAEQWDVVQTLAHQLRTRFGMAAGDRVAVAMRNYPEWSFVFWAAQLLGAVVVPLNAWLTARELEVLLDDSQPAVLVADGERLDRLASRPGLLDGMRGVVSVRCERPGSVPFAELVAAGGAGDMVPFSARSEDVATILYTSGTTGVPKGVVGTHLNHTSTILSMRLRAEVARRARPDGLQEAPQDDATAAGTTLVTFPLFHIAGLTMLTSNAFAGRRVVLMYKWDADEAVRLIALERVSEMAGPPLVVRQTIEAAARGDHDLSSLVTLGSGGAPAPPQQVRDIASVFAGRVNPATAYGLTETTSAVLSNSGVDFLTRPTSIGRPLPTVEIRVCDEDRHPVPVGTAGELWIRGPQVAAGYHRRPEDTAEAFPDGWFRTGDLVTQEEDGFVHLVGRLKDVLIRGGENVYCAEVESALEDHPDVLEAAVVGRPHPTLGEEVDAVVRLRHGRSLEDRQLIAFVSDRLAAFKVPTRVVFTEGPLPRTASGKLLKRGLTAAVGGGTA